jgi:DNA-binding LacI/PurR family transcriptional regulator
MEAMAAFREERLRVSDDISLVGFGDLPRAHFSDPPLTTTHFPAAEPARTACLVLMDLIQGREPISRRVLLTTELILRKSSRKLYHQRRWQQQTIPKP